MPQFGGNHSKRDESGWDEDINTSFAYQRSAEDNSAEDLDQCRLYITNLPPTLTEDGLANAFSKYGTLCEVFVNCDPNKRYALVRYENPGEANLAISCLNQASPLNLSVKIAKKSGTGNIRRPKNNNYNGQNQKNQRSNRRRERDYEEDSLSSSSVTRHAGIDVNDEYEDDNMDLEFKMKLLDIQERKLILEYQSKLKQKEATTMSSGGGLGSRSIIPGSDGKIIIQTGKDKPFKAEKPSSFVAGAGDSSPIPALQPSQCVSCDAAASHVCGGCGLTPYCSAACQRRDWTRRHSSLCHNLASISPKIENTVKEEPHPKVALMPPAPPLRPPHTPATRDNNTNSRKSEGETDRAGKNFVPAGYNPPCPKKPTGRNDNRYYKSDNNRSGQDENNRSRKDENYRSGKDENNCSRKDENCSGNRSNVMNRLSNIKNQGSHEQTKAKDDEPKADIPIRSPIKTPALDEPKPVPVFAKPSPSASDAAPVKPSFPSVAAAKPVPKSKAASKPLMPPKCLIEVLDVGAPVLISVDNTSAECADSRPGFVCLSLNADFQDSFERLIGPFAEECESQTEMIKPAPGELFAIHVADEAAWYRARCLTPQTCALIDAGRVISIGASKCAPLTKEFTVVPEFNCLLNAPGIKVGDSFECTIKSRASDGTCKVSIVNKEGEAALPDAEITRWLPKVELPQPEVQKDPVVPEGVAKVAPPVIPSVARPPLQAGVQYVVLDAEKNYLLVRRADVDTAKSLDIVENDVAEAALKAKTLTEPASQGDTVIAKYTDGNFYRALVARTSVAKNKYQLEYVEYGNIEVLKLENLYTCPASLSESAVPALTSRVKLPALSETLSQAAAEYLSEIKDSATPLLLTLPDGKKSVPSGEEAILTLIKTGDKINEKLEEMCKPEWKKIEENGKDVTETEILLLKDLEYLPVPKGGGTLQILDASALEGGILSVCPVTQLEHMKYVLGPLTEKITAYCNSELGRDPYLPRAEELCIAQCPPYDTWFRAVLCEHAAGEDEAQLLFLDYGNLQKVSIQLMRKMLPEFVRGVPVLAIAAEIKGFPSAPTAAALARAKEVIAEAGDTVEVTKCESAEPGFCEIEAPKLIEALNLV